MSWRDLPVERFGPWHTVYARFRRWRQAGVWLRVLAQVQNATGLHRLLVDSTAVRAHQVAAGAKKKTVPVVRCSAAAAVASPLSCDVRGRICALALTGGQAGDCPQAPGLLRRHLRPGQAVLADRAYDAGYVRAQIQQAGATAVILSKKNRLVPLDHDAEIIKNETILNAPSTA